MTQHWQGNPACSPGIDHNSIQPRKINIFHDSISRVCFAPMRKGRNTEHARVLPETMLTTAAHASPGEKIPGNSGNGQGVDLHALPAEQPLLSRDGNGSQASLLAPRPPPLFAPPRCAEWPRDILKLLSWGLRLFCRWPVGCLTNAATEEGLLLRHWLGSSS
jgi:hypothetical protein